MTRSSHMPLVKRRRRHNVMLNAAAVDAVREHILPLLPGVSLSDLLDAFLRGFVDNVVPVVAGLNDLPEEVRAGAAESAMAEMLGRMILGVRTEAPSLFPLEVKSG